MPTRATRVQSGAMGNRAESAGLVAPQVSEPAPDLATLAEAAATPGTRTRSGRVSKPPVRYEPVEQVEDDYAPEDYDTEDPDDSEEDISTDDEDEEDDESDADEDGNLDGFVVPDKSESDGSESDGEPAVPVAKRRAVVKKRPAARA
jgi:hypothetical protein